MLYIKEDLRTKEAAEAYNKKIYDYRANAVGHPGCISSLACLNCYHVISDSVCLCIGTFTCPKCGKENMPKWRETLKMLPKGTFKFIPDIPKEDIVEDYSI